MLIAKGPVLSGLRASQNHWQSRLVWAAYLFLPWGSERVRILTLSTSVR